jgi:hypothetical protein
MPLRLWAHGDVNGRQLRCDDTRSCGCWYHDSRTVVTFKHGQIPAFGEYSSFPGRTQTAKSVRLS